CRSVTCLTKTSSPLHA
ncbi:DEAD/DEAH box helicase family protein, partial [Vibrio parahaemolyticus V-223/04]